LIIFEIDYFIIFDITLIIHIITHYAAIADIIDTLLSADAIEYFDSAAAS
jgi:hypothetical protein